MKDDGEQWGRRERRSKRKAAKLPANLEESQRRAQDATGGGEPEHGLGYGTGEYGQR